MLTKRKIVSLSFSPRVLTLLDKFCQKKEKSRSEVVRDLIRRFLIEEEWEEIFQWGRQTAKKFKIRSEADILRLIND